MLFWLYQVKKKSHLMWAVAEEQEFGLMYTRGKWVGGTWWRADVWPDAIPCGQPWTTALEELAYAKCQIGSTYLAWYLIPRWVTFFCYPRYPDLDIQSFSVPGTSLIRIAPNKYWSRLSYLLHAPIWSMVLALKNLSCSLHPPCSFKTSTHFYCASHCDTKTTFPFTQGQAKSFEIL